MTLSIESKGEIIPCHKLANIALATCCKVAVLEDLEIPPRCELMVPGATMGGIVPSTGVIEPKQLFVQRKGLLVAKFSIDTNKKVIPLRVINLLYESCKLYQAKIVQNVRISKQKVFLLHVLNRLIESLKKILEIVTKK